LTALGSFLIAVGILTVPHDSSPTELYAKMMTGMGEGKRTIIAFGFIAVGVLLGITGFISGALRQPKAE
jgi:hypothetical protein